MKNGLMHLVGLKAATRKASEALTDEELWHAFSGGDDAAYTLLYFRYADRLYSYLRLLLGAGPERHYIEDVFQDAWILVYKEKEKFEIREDGSFCGWLFRIAHNRAMTLIRRPHYVSTFNEMRDSEQVLDTYSATSAQEMLSDNRSYEEVMAKLRGVVEALPISFREVYLLSEFEQMNIDQITETLGISKANVKVRLFRARRMVRERMIEVLDIDKMFTSKETEETEE